MKPSLGAVIAALAVAVSANVRFAGVNIAGCDFGCVTNGHCYNTECPLLKGPQQMRHFAQKDGFNIFRLPVGWQYLVNHNLNGKLDEDFMQGYDNLIMSCLSTGAYCIIDVHNYARWNGGIIGQDGPTQVQFENLWLLLAVRYRKFPKVVFGLMNEPHDLDMDTWASTVQRLIFYIRDAGIKSHYFLIPGTDYSDVQGFPKKSAPALSKVVDADGSTSKLVYDIHKYYDIDTSGTHTNCVSDHIEDSFAPMAKYLRENNRLALLSETGGGNTPSCVEKVCAVLDYLNKNSDVFLGWLGWAAGAFEPNYELSEVPVDGKDTLLVEKCIAGKFNPPPRDSGASSIDPVPFMDLWRFLRWF